MTELINWLDDVAMILRYVILLAGVIIIGVLYIRISGVRYRRSQERKIQSWCLENLSARPNYRFSAEEVEQLCRKQARTIYEGYTLGDIRMALEILVHDGKIEIDERGPGTTKYFYKSSSASLSAPFI